MAGAASYADDGRLSPLSTPSATRAVLEAHGIGTKYTLGQNFLVNDDVLKKIVALAEAGLLKHAASVTAVERDPDLPAVLADTLWPWRETFALIEKDALDLTADDLGEPLPNKLVANLPYAVAATVVLDYFERFPSLQSATIMVQKEVADRMAAERGTKNYGAYTVKLGLYAEVAGRFAVGPGNFFPPPRVDSAVIRLNRRVPVAADGTPASPALIAAAARMADAAFANRRKTLANSCKTYFAGDPAAAAALPAIFAAAAIDPRRRGETLDQAEFIALGAALIAEVGER